VRIALDTNVLVSAVATRSLCPDVLPLPVNLGAANTATGEADHCDTLELALAPTVAFP